MYIQEARNYAEENYKNMVTNFPAFLKKGETKIFKNLKKINRPAIIKLKKLYLFMDHFYEHINRYTPCQKSCSDCCFYSVTVSDIEILQIEKTYKIKRKKVVIPVRMIQGTPCCFLESNLCLIYDARPFVCRRHVILAADNAWCSHDCEHKFPMLSFSEIDRSYERILQESKSIELYDIREVF
jgi:Fe-S-cluster containining protein